MERGRALLIGGYNAALKNAMVGSGWEVASVDDAAQAVARGRQEGFDIIIFESMSCSGRATRDNRVDAMIGGIRQGSANARTPVVVVTEAQATDRSDPTWAGIFRTLDGLASLSPAPTIVYGSPAPAKLLAQLQGLRDGRGL